MKSVFVPTPDFVEALRGVLLTAAGFTDDTVTVSLVEGEFDPADPDSWPTASTHFAPLESGAECELVFDAVSEQWFLSWPDPVGGWVFTAATITDSVTVSGFLCKVGTNLVGANTLSPAPTVTANDQTITLPYVAVPVTPNVVEAADVPFVIE